VLSGEKSFAEAVSDVEVDFWTVGIGFIIVEAFLFWFSGNFVALTKNPHKHEVSDVEATDTISDYHWTLYAVSIGLATISIGVISRLEMKIEEQQVVGVVADVIGNFSRLLDGSFGFAAGWGFAAGYFQHDSVNSQAINALTATVIGFLFAAGWGRRRMLCVLFVQKKKEERFRSFTDKQKQFHVLRSHDFQGNFSHDAMMTSL